jgi:UDP-glucuronate decarboxylase
MTNTIVREDMETIFRSLSSAEKEKLHNSTVLVTGAGGFLGFYFMQFFVRFANHLQLKKVIVLENFITGNRDWLQALEEAHPDFITLHNFNVIHDRIDAIPGADHADFIIHLASIASPSFYRKYPIETVDANVTGLRKLLDFYAHRTIKGFLFFSSSEVYGDPLPDHIPTREEYRGNVATIGPRACYDEAKRFGETLCYLFAEQYSLPISIVRPFNNYGPGMNIDDKRLPADLAKAVLEGCDLVLHSDGNPTRTFCYIADAITGYLKVLLSGRFDVFNIGMDQPEVSVRDFAEFFRDAGKKLFGYQGEIRFMPSAEQAYLTDNPSRRCPDISKARTLLGFNPVVTVHEGIERYLLFLRAKHASTRQVADAL